MTSNEPGDRRRLARRPSVRYDPGAAATDPSTTRGSTLGGPLLRASVAAILGAAVLVVVGAVLASTFGLLFVAGAMGVAVGLLLARAKVAIDGAPTGMTQSSVTRLAMAIAVLAVVAADIGTWLYAVNEGGTLGLVDYLLSTFGPFVPAVAVVAVVAAAWGASAGPVQR